MLPAVLCVDPIQLYVIKKKGEKKTTYIYYILVYM